MKNNPVSYATLADKIDVAQSLCEEIQNEYQYYIDCGVNNYHTACQAMRAYSLLNVGISSLEEMLSNLNELFTEWQLDQMHESYEE